MIFYPLKEVSCAKIWPQNNIFKTEIENKFSSRFVRKVAKASAASVTRFGEISPFWKKYLTVFGNFQKFYLVFGSILNVLGQKNAIE